MFARITTIIAAVLFIEAWFSTELFAVQFYGMEDSAPVLTLQQPNEGTPVTFQAKLWGSSLVWEFETTSGYTIIENSDTGYWVYATLHTDGYYFPSDSAVGINSPPSGVSPHLRRSAACLASIDSLVNEINDFQRQTYQAYWGVPDSIYRLGILFWEFDNRSHQTPDTFHYNWDNVNMMFVSDTVFFGPTHGQQYDEQTPWHEEPFGSVNDWFKELSAGEVSITAGGPFPNDSTLIINPVNGDGTIEWLNMGWEVNDWWTIIPGGNRFTHDTVLDSALARGWLADESDQDFDILILIVAGSNFAPGRLYPGGWTTPLYIDGRGFPCVRYGEFQSGPGHVSSIGANDIVQATKITNIGAFCHELIHAIGGTGHPDEVAYTDVMFWGVNLAPLGGFTNATCTFGRQTCPCRMNPQFLSQFGWCNLVEITGDMSDLKIGYTKSYPTIYYYDYDASYGAGGDQRDKQGRFFLESRHFAVEENEHFDFNSFTMGSYEWNTPGYWPGGDSLERTPYEYNLLIWHREGYKETPITADWMAGGIFLERADANWDNRDIGDGNDLFPGNNHITEFGPGTGERRAVRIGRNVGWPWVKNYMIGSSHDVISASEAVVDCVLTNYRELQTGFCINNIVVGEDDSIICDIYTNYWGGEVNENLNLSGNNVYLGQDFELIGDNTVTISAADLTTTVNLDSDVLINGENATLYFDGDCYRMDVYLNGYDIIIDEGRLVIGLPLYHEPHPKQPAIYPNQGVFIHGPGSIRYLYNGGGGVLSVVGFTDQPVTFTSDEAIPAAGDWDGIIVEDAAGYVDFEYVDIMYATDGLKIDNCTGTVEIDHVTVTDFYYTGFNIVNSSPTLTNCSASNSEPQYSMQPVGLYCYDSSPVIENCDFDNNYRGAEFYGLGCNVKIGYSSFSDNADAGIYNYDAVVNMYNSTAYDYGYNQITDNGAEGYYSGTYATSYLSAGTSYQGMNSIYGNTTYEVKNVCSLELPAEFNWWGSDLGPMLIYGNVDYSPWLMEDPNGTPPSPAKPPTGGGLIADEDVDPFHRADSLFASGRYAAALEAYSNLADNREFDGLLRAVRQMRECYRQLDRRNDWRQMARGLNEDQNIVAALRPVFTSLYAGDLAADSPDSAEMLIRNALRNLDDEVEFYPNLLFQLGMVQLYAQRDAMAASTTFRSFIRQFAEHPLNSAAMREWTFADRISSEGRSKPEPNTQVPEEFGMLAVYPNPFNSSSRVTFSLPSASEVKLTLSDIAGRKVSELLNGSLMPGMHQLQINGSDLPAGVYIIRLESVDRQGRLSHQARKAVVVK